MATTVSFTLVLPLEILALRSVSGAIIAAESILGLAEEEAVSEA